MSLRLNAGVVGKCHRKHRGEERGGVSNNLSLTRHRKQSKQDSDYSHFYTQCFLHASFFSASYACVWLRDPVSLWDSRLKKKKKEKKTPILLLRSSQFLVLTHSLGKLGFERDNREHNVRKIKLKKKKERERRVKKKNHMNAG